MEVSIFTHLSELQLQLTKLYHKINTVFLLPHLSTIYLYYRTCMTLCFLLMCTLELACRMHCRSSALAYGVQHKSRAQGAEHETKVQHTIIVLYRELQVWPWKYVSQQGKFLIMPYPSFRADTSLSTRPFQFGATCSKCPSGKIHCQNNLCCSGNKSKSKITS